MMFWQSVMGLECRDEIDRNYFCALMQELEIGVLTVRPDISPDDGTGPVFNGFTVFPNLFPIAFHFKLLEIIRKTDQILKIRRDGNG